MSSLHARRPPRLEQGAHLRKTKRSTGITPKRGACSLRRPPSASASASGTEPEMGNSGGGNSSNHSSKKKCCNLQRTMVCTFVAVVLMFLFMQIRGVFGLMLSNSDASHLRGVSIGKSGADAVVKAP